ncbi:proteasomal ubiquitin receptor ADRM1 homolog [Drosophila gunungcola]|uniref:Proteasomal ubiquitin receptor ADRM1 homolog n=1 Tax=Drosophila gunungcola TaxID=103775 RepID=A0A9Q0BK38_9MUSC|nr:proteasomal ubiquitin receptor ADRM1 homolog [Drosophila gunungcola]KAI8035432.1 hypothetical protein M5D96_011775 [Drosophila gunungcola]
MAEPVVPNLAEYKAGRMIVLGKMVEPDERKGLLYVRRYASDNQVHIHWMDRHSGTVELDIVATPGGLEFRRIEQCKTGRVYVLKYTRSAQRFFFWMQEPKETEDAAFCRRVNELIASGQRNWDECAAAEGDVDTDVERENSRRSGGGEIGKLRVLKEMRQFLVTNLPGSPETCLQTTNQSLTDLQSGDDDAMPLPPLPFQDPDAEIPDLAFILR